MATATLPSPLGVAALQYARRGWRVFPCRERDDSYQNSAGKRVLLKAKAPYVRHGVDEATADEEQIKAWWKRWPEAMIGLALGDAQDDRGNLFVLDFDPRHDVETGEEWTLESLKGELEALTDCQLPTSLAVRTPSTGVHVYLTQPEGSGEQLRNRAGTKKNNLPQHVDVRAKGGYVIVPPSYCYGGVESGAAEGQYRWLRGKADAAVVAAPDAVIALCQTKGKAAGGEPAPRREETVTPIRPLPASIDAEMAAELRKYAMRGLDLECQDIRAAKSGARNAELNNSALKIASLVAAGVLDATIARSSIEAAARDNPGRDDDAQLLATIESGWSAGIERPRDLEEIASAIRARLSRPRSRPASSQQPRPSQAAASSPAPSNDDNGAPSSHSGWSGDQEAEAGGGGDDAEDQAAADDECARYPLTDLGNAERFRRRFGRDFLYVPEWGWLAWDGKRWNRDQANGLVARAVYDTVRAIGREAKLVEESGDKDWPDAKPGARDFVVKATKTSVTMYSDTIRAWGRTSESAGHLACIARLAEPYLTARPADFDADPMMINLLNWTLEFGTPPGTNEPAFRLLPFNREHRITKLAAVEWDPDAKCPIYDRFLGEVQPDPEMRGFLHAWGGYNLTGSISAQKFVLNYGEGANGKSTWVDTVAWMIGDYSRSCGIETFVDQGRQRKGGDATPDLAALTGRRMVRTAEPEKGAKFSDGLIKALTGGEPMNVRELNMPFYEMIVTFKVTCSANIKPQIGTDHGIKRRVRLVPWDVIIPDERQDDQLTAKLKAEGSGILNHLIQGCLAWMRDGLPEPEAIKEATRDYQEENDPLGRFLGLCVAPGKPEERVQSSLLYDIFRAWAKWAGEENASGKPWSQKWFTNQMKLKGHKTIQSNTIQWIGIVALKAVRDFVDAEGNVIVEQATSSHSPSSSAALDPDDPY
ncbi:phage/plasmid primase, P4 family [Sphingomonas montanisoli]|uniref:DNA primase n=1 Tax=Sphingomonas montanisoli TaxID=2606412 RepID=A0A5D9C4U1_9SPHN|nr:phage/plasmid primase, P4 family [Sphingomonas montanisoli]TZG26493.1 DNA primase [Sphingomonas montanisoli]